MILLFIHDSHRKKYVLFLVLSLTTMKKVCSFTNGITEAQALTENLIQSPLNVDECF